MRIEELIQKIKEMFGIDITWFMEYQVEIIIVSFGIIAAVLVGVTLKRRRDAKWWKKVPQEETELEEDL